MTTKGEEEKMKMLCVADYEREAHKTMAKMGLDYYRSGADDEITLHANKDIFKEFRIMARFLRDVSRVQLNDFKLDLSGSDHANNHQLTCPLGVSPTAMHKLAHPDGELATAKAVSQFGSIMILSTLSSTSIEDVARAQPNLIKWFQLYLFVDRSQSLQLIRRAELAKFKALVLTVDAPVFGIRRRDLRNEFKVPAGFCANFSQKEDQAIHKLDYIDASINWSDITWLRKQTKLPIFIKGLLTPEDAELAIEYGASGIIVSNHGGRQLDSAPATIEALPRITSVVRGRCPVLVDGGIRTGADIFKCLAMGANMVFVGRPVLYGLACDGAEGALKVLQILRNELELTMKLAGCQKISDINRAMVIHKSQLIPKL